MLKDTDIFFESSKGGTWERKGFTDEDMWAVNPKLIIVHCSGYGKFGDPDRVKRPAYDGTVGPYAGLTCQNGTAEQPMISMPYLPWWSRFICTPQLLPAHCCLPGCTAQG